MSATTTPVGSTIAEDVVNMIRNSVNPPADIVTGGDELPSDEPIYFRGFFDARKRIPEQHEDTITRNIIRGLFVALPTVAMFYLFTRARTAMVSEMSSMATKPGEKGAKKGMFGQAMEQATSMMNPMGNRDFETKLSGTTFKDVVGISDALVEVKQYVDFLKTPEKFTRLGGRLPKGCLLTGQPGTGKTMLAKAVAGEAGVPFFSCSGADFIEIYAGSGPKRVRDLFEAAKKAAPSVIFIDEIDAVGSRNGGKDASSSGSSSEENRTVNQILAELDGLQKADSIVVLAATNFPDNLDKALLREGRFDRKVEIPMPDLQARNELFQHYLKKVVTGDADGTLIIKTGETTHTNTADADVSNAAIAARLSGLTPGISPATISAIVNEAALAAAIQGDQKVTVERLLPAIDDVLVGKKNRNRMSETSAKRIALHEGGHTIIAWLLSHQAKVIKVSINPRGMAGGFTQQLGQESLEHTTDTKLFTDLCVLLGGRGAELTENSNLTTGASDDYQRATENALRQMLAFGMNSEIGLLSYDHNRLNQGRMYQHMSEGSQHRAETAASQLVAIAQTVVQKILDANKDKLQKVKNTLFEKKELLEEDLEAILGPRPAEGTVHPLVAAALKEYELAAIQATISQAVVARAEHEANVAADIAAEELRSAATDKKNTSTNTAVGHTPATA
jgi:AFG3 family protein